ncbi:MAG: tetratricopeptide repeat protein [Spirochaetaceae bacterium]|jgi:tetratricopeptide (TPR) repeat protein|nr:tetratricopeptide repeat protein [Spirochaetaceae bacterium]
MNSRFFCFIAVCAGLSLFPPEIFAQPYDKEYYHLRAQQYLAQGNLPNALEVYNLLIGTDPNDARAFNGRGKVFERRSELNHAMADYEHAIELSPDYAEALHNRSALLQKFKNEKPPSVTFPAQGAAYNEYIFNPDRPGLSQPGNNWSSQTGAPSEVITETGAVVPAAPQRVVPARFPKPGEFAAEETSFQRGSRLQYYETSDGASTRNAQNTAGAQDTQSGQNVQSAQNTPNVQNGQNTANAAAGQDFRPVRQTPPAYVSAITPSGAFIGETGYGVDTRYLPSSQFQQPATSSYVDGTLTPRQRQTISPAPVETASAYRVEGASQPAPRPAVQSAVTQSSTTQSSATQNATRGVAPLQPLQPLQQQQQPSKSTAPVQTAAPPSPQATVSADKIQVGGTLVMMQPAEINGGSMRLGAGATGTNAPILSAPSQKPAIDGVAFDTAERHNNTGIVLYNAGNYSQAVEEFTQAITKSQGFARAYNNRGAAYAQMGETSLALQDFNQALKINPYYFDAQHNRELLRGRSK